MVNFCKFLIIFFNHSGMVLALSKGPEHPKKIVKKRENIFFKRESTWMVVDTNPREAIHGFAPNLHPCTHIRSMINWIIMTNITFPFNSSPQYSCALVK